jgi:molybdopterin-containing oxidoreductase family iron-sulfur binding subunit
MDKCPSHPSLTDTAAAPQRFWRSLDELAARPEVRDFIEREFPRNASEWLDPVSRRNFLKMMSASMALAGLGAAGCARQPEETIVPYVTPPEHIIPGRPLQFATAIVHQGYGIGVLAESHMGRPTKLEGNPDHPASLGAIDHLTQASILTLYDPDRAQVVTNVGNISTWAALSEVITAALNQLSAVGGKGLRILSGSFTSPTLAWQRDELLKRFPQMRWHHSEPFGRDNERLGERHHFDKEVNTVYRLDKARRIVSLDADFLFEGPGHVRMARDFAAGRHVRVEHGDAPIGAEAMNRLYVVESTPTTTGASADHRLRMPAGKIAGFASALLHELHSLQTTEPTDAQAVFLRALAADLRAHRGSSVVIAGPQQPMHVHMFAHAINSQLDAVGNTLIYIDPVEATDGSGVESLRQLVNDMRAGEVSTLIILGGNPVFNAPADLDFVGAMQNVPLRVHHSLYYDETSYNCHWHIPETHDLEQWGDVRGHDGTVSIIQPLIAPLYRGRSVWEVVAGLLGDPGPNGRQIIRHYWQETLKPADFESFWRMSLEKGVVEGTASPAVNARSNILFGDLPSSVAPQGLELIFRPDPSIHDGRYANNGWLQELPRPLTRLTWDNAALLSPATARRLGLSNEDVIQITLQDQPVVRIAAWILPGHPDESITLPCGFGRSRVSLAPTIGAGVGVGVDVYPLRTTSGMHFTSGATVTRTGETYRLACTQPHQMINTKETGERDIVRAMTLGEFSQTASDHHKTVHLSLYPDWNYGKDGLKEPAYPGQHAWGMAIDMTACNGCQACVVACQAENNIPVVGKEQVIFGREMQWLRIDTYYEGDGDDPQGPHFQPMMCQHCESAPCEVVCPVAATSHSAEGLNEMTYNRCVGTRYCSNNCPYKVRRFNFLTYARKDVPVLNLMYNPDVTVRDRGVMEKCTYCVQRINQTRIEIKKLGVQSSETGADPPNGIDALLGGLQTACQQACPSQAIVFGDLNRERITGTRSAVRAAHEQPHAYGVLSELNTKPRTVYLARVANPNPALATVTPNATDQ